MVRLSGFTPLWLYITRSAAFCSLKFPHCVVLQVSLSDCVVINCVLVNSPYLFDSDIVKRAKTSVIKCKQHLAKYSHEASLRTPTRLESPSLFEAVFATVGHRNKSDVQTIAVRNVVIPAAVCMAVDCHDCKSAREPISSHTGEGHTATRLIQLRHRIVYYRRRNTATACHQTF